MEEIFWINEPLVLFNKEYITNIIPSNELSYEAKLNAMTRLILLVCVLGYLFTKNIKIIISGVISIIAIVVIHKTNSKNEANNQIKEGFESEVYKLTKENLTTPTQGNPMMNVMLPEIKDNPTRKTAAPSYMPEVEKDINDSVKEGLDSRLFQDLGDNIEFETSMRSFYTTPNTTIPNDQTGFAEFCYGGMKSCKEGDDIQCHEKNYRHINHN